MLARTLSVLAALLTAASLGCAGTDDTSDEDADTGDSALGVAQGVDYSWARPSPDGLRAAGYTFAARYLSVGSSGKNISRDEADALIAAGVDVVLVFEQEADAVLDGYWRGVSDAQAAAQMAADAGQPGDRPIYFAVDFDAQPSEQPTVDAYFDGVADVVGRSRTGAYGGYYLISRLFDGGKITWGWQAYAWSYGNWDDRAQVRQVQNGVDVAGGEVDLDTAMVPDFGQWGNGSPGGVPGASSIVEVAFQANTSSLWTTGSAGTRDWALGMMTNTSPAIAASGDGYQVAFQANTSSLWSVGSDGSGGDLMLGMMPGTSPSIAALEGGGYQIAFQANTGSLWTTGAAGTADLALGMRAGTSPSITALAGGGYQIAFQANTTSLWTTGTLGTTDWALGMMDGTSPAIAGLSDGSFTVAFQANTSSLWVVSSVSGGGDQMLGLLPGTSPAITALPGNGWEVAFQANTTSLWTHGTAGTTDWALGMMPGSSPSIGATPEGSFQVNFEANTTNLWTLRDGVGTDLMLGMMKGSSPSGT